MSNANLNRRRFLGSTLAGAAVGAPALFGAPVAQAKDVTVGIIYVGRAMTTAGTRPTR
jgi:hypothetical protein